MVVGARSDVASAPCRRTLPRRSRPTSTYMIDSACSRKIPRSRPTSCCFADRFVAHLIPFCVAMTLSLQIRQAYYICAPSAERFKDAVVVSTMILHRVSVLFMSSVFLYPNLVLGFLRDVQYCTLLCCMVSKGFWCILLFCTVYVVAHDGPRRPPPSPS